MNNNLIHSPDKLGTQIEYKWCFSGMNYGLMLSITMATNDITTGFNQHKTQLLMVSICWRRSFQGFWGYEYVSTSVVKGLLCMFAVIWNIYSLCGLCCSHEGNLMKITVCIWLVTFVDNIWSENASANKSFLIVNRDTSPIKQMLSKYTV